MAGATVRVQTVWNGGITWHKFSDYERGVRFMSALTFVPVKRIRRHVANNPLLPSFTASREGVFVRIERVSVAQPEH